jgi:hypothetical protein
LGDLDPAEVHWDGDPERLVAAIVLPCQGRWDWFEAQVELARLDWRDVLMNGGLGHADWRKELRRRLRA